MVNVIIALQVPILIQEQLHATIVGLELIQIKEQVDAFNAKLDIIQIEVHLIVLNVRQILIQKQVQPHAQNALVDHIL